ncbi:MlaA family lipoprotein [Pseudogemmobacter sonorensis]|uniref:MlaA family lipoprotein n=1 Tax=Pseudogemmobacter sonorensis TaxID=2989681 RepID=UPI0036B93C06
MNLSLSTHGFPGRFPLRGALVGLIGLALSACAAPPSSQSVHDPIEPVNRAVHGFNKGLDTVALRPASQVYGKAVPAPVRKAVSNVADTLDLPGTIANDLLQFRIGDAVTNTLRLGLNLTLGLGGTIDFATAAGLPDADNDFGRTLATWGVGEGAYVELPGFGPSTARDAVGVVVDLAMNPLGQVFDGDDAKAVTGAELLSQLDKRYRYSNTVDQILYESADSYAQARLLYLQNRRFVLGQGGAAADGADDDFIDPYEDLYGE